jgi:hypothetical protein
MLIKSPSKKSSWSRFGKLGLKLGVAGVVCELAALGGSYIFYRRLNNDQGRRTHELNYA